MTDYSGEIGYMQSFDVVTNGSGYAEINLAATPKDDDSIQIFSLTGSTRAAFVSRDTGSILFRIYNNPQILQQLNSTEQSSQCTLSFTPTSGSSLVYVWAKGSVYGAAPTQCYPHIYWSVGSTRLAQTYSELGDGYANPFGLNWCGSLTMPTGAGSFVCYNSHSLGQYYTTITVMETVPPTHDNGSVTINIVWAVD